MCYIVCKNWNLLREKKHSIHAHKTWSWYLVGILSKIPMSTPIFFIWKRPYPRDNIIIIIIIIIIRYNFILLI